MTPPEAAKLVATLSAAYPRAAVTVETSRVYERMLADLDFDVATKAVARVIATSRFLPTIAEIRIAAAEVEHGPVRVGGEAWGDVGFAIRRFGARETPRLLDPVAAQCVRLLGWHSICSPDNESAIRAHFIRLYDQLAAQNREQQVAGLALPPSKAPERLPERVSGRQAVDHAWETKQRERSGSGGASVHGGGELDLQNLGDLLGRVAKE
jgi:hypothetical protein